MPSRSTRLPRRPLLALAGGIAASAVVGALVLRGVDLRGWIDVLLERLRSAGPDVFFLGMALLPMAPVPMLAFSLTAMPIHGPQLGTGPVLLLALGAATCNYVLTYLLARRALRPVLSRIMDRLGYRLPEMDRGDATDLIIVLRATPGIPFFAQNYLAGLAEVPFGRYLLISGIFVWPMNAAFLLFGDALLQGKGKVALACLGAVIAFTAAVHLVRRRYERRRGTP